MEDRMKASQTHADQYWFVDGWAELSGWVICVMISIYFAVLAMFSSSHASFAATFLALFVMAYGVRWAMIRIRQHYTYPRTGYVELKRGEHNRLTLGISIAFTALLLAFMMITIARGIQGVGWMPAIGGVIFAFIFSLAGYRVKLVRFYFLAGFCLLLGITLSLCGIGDLWGAAILSLVTSLALFSFGIATRIIYLRQSTSVMEPIDES